MKVKDIVQLPGFEIINESNMDRSINQLFSSDLLSHVMGNANEHDVLFTVLSNINVIGVASLLDFSAVIFTHNILVGEDIIQKASELDIPLLRTSLSTAEAVIKVHTIGDLD
jgi:serine kinase of HPr protein (carbohydrate metabolism regulator)